MLRNNERVKGNAKLLTLVHSIHEFVGKSIHSFFLACLPPILGEPVRKVNLKLRMNHSPIPTALSPFLGYVYHGQIKDFH